MATVRGVCRRCGAQKSFPAGIDVPPATPRDDEFEAARPTTLRHATASVEEYTLV
jgi:hypothetical protein